jgi:hypothetical protein
VAGLFHSIFCLLSVFCGGHRIAVTAADVRQTPLFCCQTDDFLENLGFSGLSAHLKLFRAGN